MPEFQVGQKVMLRRRNITTNRPTIKLDYQRLGPFTITDVDARNVTLDLGPEHVKLHNTFHVSVVEPYISPSTIEQRINAQQPLVPDIIATQAVTRILDSRKRGLGVQYRVLREGQAQHEVVWIPFSSLMQDLDAVSHILQFHIAIPKAPSAPQLSQFDTELVPVQSEARGPTLREDQLLRPFKLVRRDGIWQTQR